MVTDRSPLILEKSEIVSDRKICPTRGDFLKTTIISPDGLFALTASESNYVGSWRMPIMNKYLYHKESATSELGSDSSDHFYLDAAFNIGECIYDFAWYPYMNSSAIGSSCFIVTSRDHPIQLWDKETGTNIHMISIFS
jgi:hypothetical protein